MSSKTFETRARPTKDGRLKLSVDVDVADADVDVVVTVTPVPTGAVDENGWPVGFFDRVAGSMPELRRGPQVNSKRGFRSSDLPSGHQHVHFVAPSEAAASGRPLPAA
jgi:hypothetical protein